MKDLKRVYTNKGIEKKYRKKLDALADAMSKSVMYWVLADYGNRSAVQMAKAIQKRIKQWKKIFGEESEKIALWFAKSLKRQVEADMKVSFRGAGLKLRDDVPLNTFKAIQAENNELITSIPEKYFTGIETVAMLALLYGWSKDRFTDELVKRYGIMSRRVKNISADQTHKTTEIFKRAICLENGVRYARWVYTYRSDRPREEHVIANGTLFELDKGCLIQGEYIYPGEKINCKCAFVPVVAEYGDDIEKELEKNVYYKRYARGY